MKVDGLHHVTAITADIDTNLEFYGRLLGLRLVWQGVNADDPEMRHIAYGDERGSPGSIMIASTCPESSGVVQARAWSTDCFSGWRARTRLTSGSAGSLGLAYRATGSPTAWRSRTRRGWGWIW